jgi:hypothetical protein
VPPITLALNELAILQVRYCDGFAPKSKLLVPSINFDLPLLYCLYQLVMIPAAINK